ncbi:hypothetical protein QRX60_21780 [Amycolatopsis mongoliensis]|uniref:Integral membrane protein n=1 Tax=Amycolatopsis mongoliensis TaxID=715475 RepID=A0A9Y2NHZ5_9PSEU|nr:hypothetical protein [Amycolatopsis sp. 4-36]WIY06346.1 hypothetical protein QRX60_21780 [Amycolatopsis sp. 4-36]
MKAAGILVAALISASVAACGTPVVGVPVPVAAPPATSTTVVAVPAAPQTVYVQQPPAYVAPGDTAEARTVVAYYDAINRRDFATAWSLGGSRIAGGGGYTRYVDGFATTSWDTVTVTDVRGSTVSVVLSAVQTDGSTRTFSGTYTVSGGVITGSHMTRTK